MIKFNVRVFTLDKPIELGNEESAPVCRIEGKDRCTIVSKTLEMYKPDSSIKVNPEKSFIYIK